MGTRDCTAEMRRGRMMKAIGFFQAASDVSDLDDSGEANDAIVTLHVHAGIAAADVICCARLGRQSTGENHVEAVVLLEAARGVVILTVLTPRGASSPAADGRSRAPGIPVPRPRVR